MHISVIFLALQWLCVIFLALGGFMTTGERIRSERERLGITQEKLSDICGITRRTQAAYELNESEPKVSYIVKFSELGADMNYIITGNKAETVLARVYEGVCSEHIDAMNMLTPEQQNEINSRIEALRNENMNTYNFVKVQLENSNTGAAQP